MLLNFCTGNNVGTGLNCSREVGEGAGATGAPGEYFNRSEA
ncbi:hypothetical protein [Klebsiella pneumoniae IS22]|nr:hypothetical protein [Klebsiella pneumoniae IS22]